MRFEGGDVVVVLGLGPEEDAAVDAGGGEEGGVAVEGDG